MTFTLTPFLARMASSFPFSRATNAIERHRIIVYLLHSVLVLTIISLQFLGLGGSQDRLPLLMSGVHLTACLTALTLFLTNRLSLSKAFSFVALVAQCTIAIRLHYFTTNQPEHFLQLILVNQIISLLAIFFLVFSFVRYTPFVVAATSITSYWGVATHQNNDALWRLFFFFLFVQFFLCLLGELLRRNVMNVSKENNYLHGREMALMRAVRLNATEIEAYLRMSSNRNPSSDDVDRLFSMLTATSQCNLVNAVRQYLKNHLMDDNDLTRIFPQLSKSETEVCHLILQGRKRNEISKLLGKSEKNIDVVRTHVRRKLNVPVDQELRRFLMDYLVKKDYSKKQN